MTNFNKNTFFMCKMGPRKIKIAIRDGFGSEFNKKINKIQHIMAEKLHCIWDNNFIYK